MDEYSIGESLAAFAERKEVGELGTPFWREYAHGVGALLRGERYRAGTLQLRGQERYWVAYLRLIESACNGDPMEAAISEN